MTALAAVITAILLAIPRAPPTYKSDQSESKDDIIKLEDIKVYDYMIIWKIVLMVVMSAFALTGVVCFLCGHGKEGVYPHPLRKTVLK